MYKQLRSSAFPVLIYSPLWLVYRSLQKIWLAWLEGNLQDFQGNDVSALNSCSFAEGNDFEVERVRFRGADFRNKLQSTFAPEGSQILAFLIMPKERMSWWTKEQD